MNHIGYYLIRPSDKLLKRLSHCSPEIQALFGEPLLWTKNEPDSPWPLEAHEMQVKLLFLASLRHDFPTDERLDTELADFLNEILDIPPMTVARFDAWWLLDHFDGVESSFEQLLSQLNVDDLTQVAIPEVPRIAQWLEQVTQEKASPEGIKT